MMRRTNQEAIFSWWTSLLLGSQDITISVEPIMSTVLPAFIILGVFFYDFISTFNLPKHVHPVARTFRSTFGNFLTIQDFDDTADVAPYCIWKTRSLVILSLLATSGWLASFIYAAAVANSFDAICSLCACITWAYASWKVFIRPPLTPPYFLIMFYGVHSSIGLFDLFVDFSAHDANVGIVILDSLRLSVAALLAWLAGSLPLEVIQPARNVAKPTDVPSNLLSSPEDSANLWSWCTLSFVEPIFHTAMSHTLDETDVWTLSPYFKHKNLFTKYLSYRAQHPSHSLLRFLLVSNSLDLLLDIMLELWNAIVGFVPAYALQQILTALAEPSEEARNRSFAFAVITFLANLSFAQSALFQNWHGRRAYERTRGQLFCALHYKALKRLDVSGNVSHDDDRQGSADLGKVVNLMQGDTYAVSQRFWEFSKIFVAPVRLVIALVFLHSVLGWSAFSGVVVVAVAYAINYPLAKYNISITRSSWKAKDRRMNIVNELFQNIRFLKFYGWENHWAQKVRNSREQELKWRVKANIVNTVIAFIWTWIPSATALTAFLCYTLIANQRLTVSKAFTSLALFSQLQEPMTALPGQFFAFLHAFVSMQRIQEFLNEPEVPDWASSLKSTAIALHAGSSKEVGFSQAVFEWHQDWKSSPSPARFRLGPIDIRFPVGKLSLISGATGSGKSAILAALLGEMSCISGSVHLEKRNHQVAYCAQNPWLEHATIRANIVFGSAYGFDQARYNTVIDACALARDLEVFDAGDMTEIGEKGITLSGGQRARIALARAMYSQATCILLDDPLAAVDMHTAQHIVERCLLGSLARGRTIILVTHHVNLCLPAASYLVELSQGRVMHQGSIQELRELGVLLNIVETEDKSPEDLTGSAELSTAENEADNILTDGKEMGPKAAGSTGKLVEAEARAEGRVATHTYLTYIRSSGWFTWILTFILMSLIRAIAVGNQVFLAKWGDAYEAARLLAASLLYSDDFDLSSLPPPEMDVRPWLMVYLYISIAGACSLGAYIALGYYASLQASRSLFTLMLAKLVRAPARFFDVTPIGRILNRFTADMNTVDDALQDSARAALSGTMNFLISFFVIITVVPSFTPFALIIAILYIRLGPPFVQVSRDLRRLESISLSPAFAGFDELLRGLTHVRAFAMEARYQDNFYQKVDKFQGFDHFYWLVSGWLRWRYDCLGSVVVFLTTLFALWSGVSDGYAALVIVQAGIFAEASRMLVRVAAQVELDFNSVERILEYLDVPQEAPLILQDNRPPAYWPSANGEIAFQDLVVRYAPGLPAVLSCLTFAIRPTEKIGVVGRTGSGKSTLALSLLRMVEPSGGRIFIDNIDISTIGLDDLRTRVTMVSQDVSLFSGTLRSNLDPFGEHADQECWEVLERCHLTSLLTKTANMQTDSSVTLDMPITQTGSLSAGERQLVALARAILRKTSIIIMDEATSQIDSRLDDQIQKTIREELSGAIVITIAHRLKTIIDYDRILVLDNGKLVEFDKPRKLLETSGGVFREMCRKSVDWPILEASILGDPVQPT